jgi:N-acyl-D-aspartate/D-glutamate deacylase
MLDEDRFDYKIPIYIKGNVYCSERGGTDACLNLKNRDILLPCYYADVTCFNPQTVRETATFEASTSRPGGIVHMLVNGVAVMKDSQFMHRSP